MAASNWDSSLPQVLERAGLAGLLDGVVSSATAGAAKPDARLFHAALQLSGTTPQESLHVGDRLENDIDGARAIGMRAALIARDGDPPALPEGVTVISTLAALPSLVLDA